MVVVCSGVERGVEKEAVPCQEVQCKPVLAVSSALRRLAPEVGSWHLRSRVCLLFENLFFYGFFEKVLWPYLSSFPVPTPSI